MLVSSIVLTALAISLVGQGVRALQEGGYVSLSLPQDETDDDAFAASVADAVAQHRRVLREAA